jgi:SAM-dependent methyltransferase
MFKWLSQRDLSPEIMDDLELGGTRMDYALDDIERVNRYLGGYRTLKKGLGTFAQELYRREKRPIRIVDLGCGGGDGLRYLARFFRNRKIPVELLGIDGNPHVLDYARRKSTPAADIRYREGKLPEVLPDLSADIFVCSLFLHHFSDEEVVALLNGLQKECGPMLILVNDLHRHWLAFLLFQVWSRLTRMSQMARHDGLLSIRKAFCRGELLQIVKSCDGVDYSLRWCWAFRWQLLLYKTGHEFRT